MSAEKYTTETETVLFNGREIRETTITPVLSPEERERRKREIESKLYDVFAKYPC